MKPFLKWAGGKYKLVDRIKKLLPKGNRFIEPFIGAGAVFLNTSYEKNIIADNNLELIDLYKYLKKEQKNFIDYCDSFFYPKGNTEKIFSKNKSLFNTTEDLRLKSALFLYLNKHGFNGLMRFNRKGEYNVSFGKYKKVSFPGDAITAFAKKLIDTKICHADFLTTMTKAKPGDVIYCDPPYLPLSKTSNFTSYGANLFGVEEHNELANLARKLAKNNITVIISNHDTELVREIYKCNKIYKFEVQRNISCKGDTRIKVKEILAVF